MQMPSELLRVLLGAAFWYCVLQSCCDVSSISQMAFLLSVMMNKSCSLEYILGWETHLNTKSVQALSRS